MSANPTHSSQYINDAPLRYEGLIDHVACVQPSIKGFPGANSLMGLTNSYLNMAKALFPLFTQALAAEDFETQRFAQNKMVDKLATEWETVFQLIANAKLFGDYLGTQNDFSWLNVLVRTAQRDLNLGSREFTVVPKVSLRYALTSFAYAPKFTALEIPISSLNAGWEWSVLWHEMAGRVSRELKRSDPAVFDVPGIQADGENLQAEIHSSMNEVISKLQKDEAVGSLVLNRLRRLFRQPQKPNWSKEWVDELFEDACSVLTFGDDFIPVLDSILARHIQVDDKKHPPREIRIRMARRLLHPEEFDGVPGDPQIEKDVARHIRTIIGTRGLALPLVNAGEGSGTHKQLKRLMRLFAEKKLSLNDTQDFKAELEKELLKDPTYEVKGTRDYSVDIQTWKAVASGDYKKMLEFPLSESDQATPLTMHGDGESGWMSITVHGTIHEFWHGSWNH